MEKYPAPLIIIHWLTFILVLLVAYLGLQLENYEFNAENFSHFRNHALIGVSIAVLTIIRLFLKKKYSDDIPDLDYSSSFHASVVNIVHGIIYLLLVIVPLIGFVNVYQTGAFVYDLGGPFPEGATFNDTLHEIHETLAFVLFALIGMHVVGIFMYSVKNKTNLLKRMCLLIK